MNVVLADRYVRDRTEAMIAQATRARLVREVRAMRRRNRP